MQSDFSVFRGHLAEACRLRKMPHDPLCAAAVDLHFAGLRALDVYRLAQIADKLDVSVDWLLGRSDVMEVRGQSEVRAPPPSPLTLISHEGQVYPGSESAKVLLQPRASALLFAIVSTIIFWGERLCRAIADREVKREVPDPSEYRR